LAMAEFRYVEPFRSRRTLAQPKFTGNDFFQQLA